VGLHGSSLLSILLLSMLVFRDSASHVKRFALFGRFFNFFQVLKDVCCVS
jgi:hypothetical protein